jgi:hypothetical protein
MAPGNPQLPLPDFDQLPTGSIGPRIRSLDLEQLEQLAGHERIHANRPQVLQVIEQRLDQLRAGAEPTTGDPAAVKPEIHDAPVAPAAVEPGPEPAINPPSHGDPTNPAQPRG